MSPVVAQVDARSAVTIPRYCADSIVSEYGVPQLLGMSFKDRARELIAIAHPDFRADLRKEANRLS